MSTENVREVLSNRSSKSGGTGKSNTEMIHKMATAKNTSCRFADLRIILSIEFLAFARFRSSILSIVFLSAPSAFKLYLIKK